MKTRKVFLMFPVFHYRLLEEYLRAMALKGWIYQSIGSGFRSILTFRKEEPQTIDYYVDYYDGGLHSFESRDQKKYRELIEQYGYTYLGGNLTLQIYQGTGSRLPIREETEEEAAYMKKTVLHELLGWLMILPVLIINGFLMLSSLDKLYFTSENPVGMLLCFCSVLFVWVWSLLPDLLWLLRVRRQGSLQGLLLQSEIRCMFLWMLVLVASLVLFQGVLKQVLVSLFLLYLLYRLWMIWNDRILKRKGILLATMLHFIAMLLSISLLFMSTSISDQEIKLSLAEDHNVYLTLNESELVKGYTYAKDGYDYHILQIKPSLLSGYLNYRYLEERKDIRTAFHLPEDIQVWIHKKTQKNAHYGNIYEMYELTMQHGDLILLADVYKEPDDALLKLLSEILVACHEASGESQ